MFAVIKSSTINTLRKQPPRGVHVAGRKKAYLKIWLNSRKKAVKNFLHTVYSFYLVLPFLLLLLNLHYTEQRRIYGYRKILDGAFRDKG